MEITKRYLKLMLFINSCILCLNVSARTTDTLKYRARISIGLKYGISIYNNLQLGNISGGGEKYSVNSKPRSYYEFNACISNKKNNYTLGFSLIQSSFSGKSRSVGAGRYNGLRYQYYYNIYQTVDYNVYYIFLGYGRDIHFTKKHAISPSVNLFFPVIYKYNINNNYDKQQTYDTTLYSLTKNAANDDTNSGYFPRLNLGLSYKYQLFDRVGIVVGISGFYGLSLAPKIPDPVDYDSVFSNSNNHSYIAYEIRKQIAVISSIGINIKLN